MGKGKKGKRAGDVEGEEKTKMGNRPKPEGDSDDDELAVTPEVTRGGFSLLAMDDDNDDDNNEERNESPDRAESPDVVIEKPKPGKKGKKTKKKKDEDDEDIDKVLAELELEYSGQKQVNVDKKSEQKPVETELTLETEKEALQKPIETSKKSSQKQVEIAIKPESETTENDIDDEAPVAKTANQKKRDKKKEKKLQEKKEDSPVDVAEGETVDDQEGEKGKKKKKGKKDEKEDKGKGPGKKTLAAMQEALKKLREEEERMRQEEEERLHREEEAERARLEALRLEKEKKERKKQKEKERKERLKAEGKFLTAKQKLDKARAQELINAMKAKGLELPEPGEKKPRLGSRIKNNKNKLNTQPPAPATSEKPEETEVVNIVEVEIIDQQEKPEVVEDTREHEDEVKDTWDAESSGEEANEADEETSEDKKITEIEEPPAIEIEESEESCEEEEEEESEEGSEDDAEESENEEGEKKTDAEKKRERALARIQKRNEDAEAKRNLENLRAAVVCVLGHVDTGKTKILDKLRRTNVQVGEAGGITQQIGATNVPMDNIKDTCKLVKGFAEMTLKLPGLLIIDTPGHESFSNLRSRGSSLCDIAILVVDIMHGLEQQTIESISLLKSRKTPFVVALNKIDRLYDWQTGGRKDVRDIIKSQADNTQRQFEQLSKEVIVQFAEQGLNASLYYENPDPRNYVSLVPTSAITGEGMGNLLALIVEFCQSLLAKRLMYSEQLQATVLEVKAIPGLGTTIDAILINGKLKEGDTIVLAGTDGPVVTQIRSLLMPQPMKELRVKNAYIEYKEIKAAQGVKIAAKDLEKAIAGLNLQVAEKPDEVEIFSEEVARELKTALSSIKLKERGVYVQASTLGSLEALLEFLRTSNIPYSGIRIGPVVKKDVMKASIMLEHEPQYATILAFDVKIERDAQELADSLGVKIFQADIIYHLFDKFMAYREELKQKKREEFKNIAVFPCKIRIIPQYVFNSRDPIVVGVMIEAGIVKEGTPLCVPPKEGKEEINLGIVTSVEQNHKPLESARKGMEVCLKIENVPGETPKLYGRHFDHTDLITSKISRQSIDACKDYFRDDLTKADWQLMVELKKLFQIM